MHFKKIVPDPMWDNIYTVSKNYMRVPVEILKIVIEQKLCNNEALEFTTDGGNIIVALCRNNNDNIKEQHYHSIDFILNPDD